MAENHSCFSIFFAFLFSVTLGDQNKITLSTSQLFKKILQPPIHNKGKANHHILERLEKLLAKYFDNDDLISKGLPTVQYIADSLNVSPKYLSCLLKVLTGQSTQQHIHCKLIAKAKEKLSTTDLTVSEIAYELGFEHVQSFNKLFKNKTNVSPLAFRQSFN